MGQSPLKLGVLGSGKGSNFQAILSAIEDGSLNARVMLVVSDVADAGILDIARDAGIPAQSVPSGRFKSKLEPEVEAAVAEMFRNAGAQLLLGAGYMRIVKEPLLRAFPGRILNIHPSLLPKFPGLEAWKQALEAGEEVTGCTVHFMDEGIDTGPIIAQKQVPIEPGDTAETLHARIQKAEHELYPAVVQSIAAGRVPLGDTS